MFPQQAGSMRFLKSTQIFAVVLKEKKKSPAYPKKFRNSVCIFQSDVSEILFEQIPKYKGFFFSCIEISIAIPSMISLSLWE